MLTYKSIFDAVTNKLGTLNIDIFVDDIKQGFENPCFFVSINPISSQIITTNKNLKELMIDIKYFEPNNDKYLYLDMLNKIEDLFSRNINVDKRYLTIKGTESDLLEDDAGYFLSFIINISFCDDANIEKEEFDVIGLININNREE